MSGAQDAPILSEEEEQRLEEEHHQKITRALSFYGVHAHRRVTRARNSYEQQPADYKRLLPNFPGKLEAIDAAIDVNLALVRRIIGFNVGEGMEHYDPAEGPEPVDFDMDKVNTTIKQFVRDWSVEGQGERDLCYKPILDEIDARFGSTSTTETRPLGDISIVVPGSGLGRLAWECANRGFTAQGNEWSVYMLMAANFVLNARGGPGHTPLHPYSHQYSNNYRSEDQVRCVRVPDVDTFSIPPSANFSMAAGDFLDVYQEDEAWDCIASSFFIDTARNVLVYLTRMFRILKPGGCLINLGPLLYHFDDNRDAPSLELSLDEVRHALVTIGFEIVKEEFPIEAPYMTSSKSMMQTNYRCVLLVAQKPLAAAKQQPEDKGAQSAAKAN